MSFVAPLFLLGLGLIALPLWLHRLQTQSSERKPFSSAMLTSNGNGKERSSKSAAASLTTTRPIVIANGSGSGSGEAAATAST